MLPSAAVAARAKVRERILPCDLKTGGSELKPKLEMNRFSTGDQARGYLLDLLQHLALRSRDCHRLRRFPPILQGAAEGFTTFPASVPILWLLLKGHSGANVTRLENLQEGGL